MNMCMYTSIKNNRQSMVSKHTQNSIYQWCSAEKNHNIYVQVSLNTSIQVTQHNYKVLRAC